LFCNICQDFKLSEPGQTHLDLAYFLISKNSCL
jgi:hypothetical protein